MAGARAGALRREGAARFWARDWEGAQAQFSAALEAVRVGGGAEGGAEGAALDGAAGEGEEAQLLGLRAAAAMRLGRVGDALSDCQEAASLAGGASFRTLRRGALAALHLGNMPSARGFLAAARAQVVGAAGEGEGDQLLLALAEACRLPVREEIVSPETPSVLKLQGLLRYLADDAEEDGEDCEAAVDFCAALQALTTLLNESSECRETFQAFAGLPTLLAFWTDSFSSQVRETLLAAYQDIWPAPAAERLGSLAQSCTLSGSEVVSVDALECLCSAAEADQRLAVRFLLVGSGEGSRVPPFSGILGALLRPETRRDISIRSAERCAAHLQELSKKPLLAECLTLAGLDPLNSLLSLYNHAHEFLGGSTEDSEDTDLPDYIDEIRDDDQMERFWKRETKRQFHPPVVRLRRAVLKAFETCVSDTTLLRAEAFTRKGSLDGGSKTVPTQLLASLLKLLKEIHERQPSRTTAVLDMKGQPRTYEKRKFAADFLDNPFGDYLLQDEESRRGMSPEDSAAISEAVSLGNTHLELCLRIMIRCSLHKNSARVLYGSGALDVLDMLHDYCSENVMILVERLYGILAMNCDQAASALCGEDASPVALCGIILHADYPTALKAADKLMAFVNTCSGNEFRDITRESGALDRCFWLLFQIDSGDREALTEISRSGAALDAVQLACQRLFMECLERSRRCQFGSGSAIAPRGGAWSLIGKSRILDMEASIKGWPRIDFGSTDIGEAPKSQPEHGIPKSSRKVTGMEEISKATAVGPSAGVPGKDPDSGLVKKGFFGKAKTRRTRAGRQLQKAKEAEKVSPTTPEQTKSRSVKVAMVDNTGSNEARKYDEGVIPVESVPSDDSDDDGLRTVWDSTLKDTAVREARKAWVNMDHGDKIRWTQTSTDVHAFIQVPKGTKARDMDVRLTSTRLTVKLHWYGRVFDGPLSRRCKASESWWVLDGEEVHIMIPKDDSYFWRSLFEGGTKKGFQEILTELVNADEPTPSYDELDQRSKDLIDEIQERQELMAEGIIDPLNGFDDFRCVIGESEDAI